MERAWVHAILLSLVATAGVVCAGCAQVTGETPNPARAAEGPPSPAAVLPEASGVPVRDARGPTYTPEWVTREVRAPRVSFHTFESVEAGGPVSYHLYTPAAYEREPARRFPVVYWLHGTDGGLAGIPILAARFDAAIEAGLAPPCLVVFVNGLRAGMYCDWADGSVRGERVIMEDLVPHVDAAHRTLARREGRLLEGFSMGGYGAARLGLGHPEMFGAVSMLAAGPMQPDLLRTPRASRRDREALLARVYGGDQAVFRAMSPWEIAARQAGVLAKGTLIRQVVGDRDETLPANEEFHRHLLSLGIPHEWVVLPGVGHQPQALLEALGDGNWAFHRAALAPAVVPSEAADAPETRRHGGAGSAE